MSGEQQLPRLRPAPPASVPLELTPVFARASGDPRIVGAGWRQQRRLRRVRAAGEPHRACDRTYQRLARNPTLVLFRLYLSEEPFGARSREFGYTHCVYVPATV